MKWSSPELKKKRGGEGGGRGGREGGREVCISCTREEQTLLTNTPPLAAAHPQSVQQL